MCVSLLQLYLERCNLLVELTQQVVCVRLGCAGAVNGSSGPPVGTLHHHHGIRSIRSWLQDGHWRGTTPTLPLVSVALALQR